MKYSEVKQSILKENFGDIKVNFKKYIPLIIKMWYINGNKDEELDGILDNVIVLNDDMYEVDFAREEVELLVAKIILYTDLEIDIDFTGEDYDLVMEFIPSIYEKTIADWNKFFKLYHVCLDQKLKNLNSVEKLISKLIKDMPSEDVMKSAMAELGKTVEVMKDKERNDN